MNRSFVRIAPWLILVLLAFGFGRWQGRQSSTATETSVSTSAAETTTESLGAEATASAPIEPSRAEVLRRELDTLHAAARTMAMPDARTYAYFEQLALDDLMSVTDQIRAMPAGNEQDLFFIMAIRRWAQLDGAAAIEQAATFPALATRQNATLGAWEAWGVHDARAAITRAQLIEPGVRRDRSLAAIMSGAATSDPRQALDLWRTAPADFRDSSLGPVALEQIVSAAYGTGKREAIQTLIAEIPPDETRTQLIAAMCSEWGGHYPEETLAWLTATVPDASARDAAMVGIFESLVQKDPPLAAMWGTESPDVRRRSAMVARAIANWVEVDPIEAELWINEQPDSRDLDGATFAMAAHFIGSKNMPRAFAWIRKIKQDEARNELLGNLGRTWSREHPTEFKTFLDQTSLNRAELDMLMSKLEPQG